MIIFKGDTREIRITLENNGVAVDPATLTEAKAWIYEYASGTILGKWSTSVEAGFGTMTITTDDKLLFAISEAETEAATIGQLIIQVSFKYADIHAVDGYHRISKKGLLGYLRDAKY